MRRRPASGTSAAATAAAFLGMLALAVALVSRSDPARVVEGLAPAPVAGDTTALVAQGGAPEGIRAVVPPLIAVRPPAAPAEDPAAVAPIAPTARPVRAREVQARLLALIERLGSDPHERAVLLGQNPDELRLHCGPPDAVERDGETVEWSYWLHDEGGAFKRGSYLRLEFRSDALVALSGW